MSAKLFQQRTLILDMDADSMFSKWYLECRNQAPASTLFHAADDPLTKALGIVSDCEGYDRKLGNSQQNKMNNCVIPRVSGPGTPEYLKNSSDWPSDLYLMNSDSKENFRKLYSRLVADNCKALFSLITNLTANMDICVILTDCSIHNALTVACLSISHYVLAAFKPDLQGIKSYRDIVENPGISASTHRTKFIAWECDSRYFLNPEVETELGDGDVVGVVRSSKKRSERRFARDGKPYASIMEKSALGDYRDIFETLGIVCRDNSKRRRAISSP